MTEELGIHVCSRWLFNAYVVADGGAGRPFVVDPGLPVTASAAARVLARLPPAALLTATAWSWRAQPAPRT